MRRLSDLFQKNNDNQSSASSRVEIAFFVRGGTNQERFTQLVAFRSQYPELKHRIQSDDDMEAKAWLLMTNQPLLPTYTDDYIFELAKKQNNTCELSNPLLALS